MDLGDAPVRDLRALLTSERAALVGLLASLSTTDWEAATEAGHWRVGDVARHLLDDDLGLLSRWRDGDTSGLIPLTGRDLVPALDAKNERWVAAAGGLSRPAVTELLAWSGAAVDAFLATVDLSSPRHVGWAGGSAPAWLDIAREHTERWVHGRHIADAVGTSLGASSLDEVLRTFVWAFPAQLGSAAGATVVGVRLGETDSTLARRDEGWSVEDGWPSSPSASLELDAEPAWRHLTGLGVPASSVRVDGDPDVVARLLAVRSIIV